MINALTTDGMVPATITRPEAEKLSDEELHQLFLELERRERLADSDPYEGQKEKSGKLATFTWIASALYLYLTSPGPGLFSVQAAMFILMGMFVAAIVFGWIGYGLQRLVAKILVAVLPDVKGSGTAKVTTLIGLVLMLVQIALIFVCAQWSFVAINGS